MANKKIKKPLTQRLSIYEQEYKLKQETLEEAAEKLTKDFPHYSVRDNMDDSEIKGWFLEALQKGAKWQQERSYSEEVRRVEVIQHSPPYNGRAYTNYAAKDVKIEFQDDGKTLKIFLK